MSKKDQVLTEAEIDQALTDAFTTDDVKSSHKYSPHYNKDAISVIRQNDGNWTGEMHKFGKVIAVRDISPAMVLERLIVHDGK